VTGNLPLQMTFYLVNVMQSKTNTSTEKKVILANQRQHSPTENPMMGDKFHNIATAVQAAVNECLWHNDR